MHHPGPARWRKAPLLLIVLATLLFCSFRAGAAPLPDPPARQETGTPDTKEKGIIPLTEYVTIGLKTRSFFNSHTTYEFGDPDHPATAPLSRLEWPLDSWWMGGELRASFPRFSVGMEMLTNTSRTADGVMHDSDWTDDNPRVKTIYSQTRCRLSPSYYLTIDADLKVSDWLGLPSWIDLRPLAGYRWQNFNFIAHDGVQWEPPGDPLPYPIEGPAIDFEQTYRQYFAGARASVDLGKRLFFRKLTALMQADFGYVEGYNKDKHLLRGERYTFEDTHGHAWHASIGLKGELYSRLTFAVEADFLQVSTTGTHRWVDYGYDMDMSWTTGVNVWSRQNSVAMTLAYAF